MPERFQRSVDSWKAYHPAWEYRLWTDTDVEELIRHRFPERWNFFQCLPYVVCKADAARYMILHEYGGVYSDLDVICNRSVEELRGHDLVLPKTEPIGYSNDFLLAAPGSALLRIVIDNLEGNFDVWRRWFVPRHFRVIGGTGPLHLSMRKWRYRGSERIHILPSQFYSSGDPEHAYVLHIRGNTWASLDTLVISFLYRNRRTLSLLGLGLLLLLTRWLVY